MALRLFTTARPLARQALRATSVVSRGFSSSADMQLKKTVSAELKYEKDQYQPPAVVKSFVGSNGWAFTDSDGDVNMQITKSVGEKAIKIEWQLASPVDMGDQENEEFGQATDFTVTVTSKNGGGLAFYASTQAGEGHRFVIGNVQAFASDAEKQSASAYSGPEFEDLDDKMQEHLDAYLGELGLDDQLCDFIDATATDKEQREYMRWLSLCEQFLN